MRPLFAIAPLALLLALIGPTPHEANQALVNFKDHFLTAKAAQQQTEDTRETVVSKPALPGNNGAFGALQTSSALDRGLRR